MSNMTVLVVDDSRVARMMVKSIISNQFPEWSLLEAGNGEDALKAIADTPIDLMVVDYNMPGMDGLELSEKIRERFPAVRGALLTANIQEAVHQRAEDLGLEFINKPIKPEPIIAFLLGE